MSLDSPDFAEALPDCIADRYDVQSLLGRGGMAAAYRVRDRASGAELALKRLNAGASVEAVELFEREYHTLNQLAHPRVVRAFDYGIDGSQPYYTMELLDGGDVRARSPIPWQAVCVMGYEICSALSLLHSRRLVHRDITPRNIRLTADGKAKLIDFGLLSPFGPAGLLAGTPPYVAPELANHMSLDGRADLFSLGGTLYYALTGRVAFPARRFEQLRDVWRGSPIPPAKLNPEIPEALDKLVMALMRIDVGSRPKSAAEVMDRLAPLLATPPSEELTVASAYLSAPQLIGRASVTTRVRKQMVRSMRGRGGGFLIAGRPGAGRSRMLDAFVLEAKLMGATPARAGASDAARGPFGVAAALVRQLHDSAPMASMAAARADADARALLFGEGGHGPAPALRDITRSTLPRARIQSALRGYLQRMAAARFVALAVDDWELSDEPSAALLASLSLEAERYRFVYAVAVVDSTLEAPGQALSVLHDRALRIEVESLSEAQTLSLLQSVFGDVPNLHGVANQLHQLTLGRPREVMSFAQHLVDEGVFSYQGGIWELPDRLDPERVPAAVEDALEEQVRQLSPAATWVARLLSLCVLQHLSRQQLIGIGELPASAVDAALDELHRNQLLAGSPSGYQLSHARAKRLIDERVPEAARPAMHDQLAGVLERNAEPVVVVAHHRLQGGNPAIGLDDVLAHAGNEESRVALAYGGFETIGGDMTARTIQLALRVAESLGRGERDLFPLWIFLAGVAAVGEDPRFYYDLPDALLALLKRDSGYDDWHALSHVVDPMDRSVQAFIRATQRYESTPEELRVQSPTDAIRALSAYVVFSIAVSSRTHNATLACTLPALLEPFVPLNPLVAAMQQNALGTCAYAHGQRKKARDLFMGVIETLDRLEGADTALVARIRAALCHAVAAADVAIGIQPDESQEWFRTEDPAQMAAIELVKKAAALQRGDWEAAESHRRKAELITLQNRTGTMFTVLREELEAHALARELTGLKVVRERLRAMAEQFPGWRGQLYVADAWYHRLREEPDKAMAAVERALALPDSLGMEDWSAAMARVVQVELLVEQAEYQMALDVGVAAVTRCRDNERDHIARHASLALALAEAKLGEYERARARIEGVRDELVALGASGLVVGRTYEYLGRIALWSRRERDFMTAARALVEHYQPGRSSVLGALYERLIEEARQAGTLDWRGVLGSDADNDDCQELATEIENTMVACEDHRARARTALRLLCAEEDQVGLLFLLHEDGLSLSAVSEGLEVEAMERIHSFAQAHLELELDDDVCTSTAGLSSGDQTDSMVPSSIELSENGLRYYPVPLIGHHDGELYVVGIALLSARGPRQDRLSDLAEQVALNLIRSGEYRPLAAA